MTDETKKLFDAPWYVFSAPDDEITVIENESGRVLAELDDVKTANRLARLPELYDALFEITLERCAKCVASHANRGIQAPLGFDFFTGECPFETDEYFDGDPCVWRQRWKLLGKVRDGE